MAVAELEKLRNFGILGQGGSGKTSLGEAMLFVSKMDHEQGDVEGRIAPMLEALECKGVYLQMPFGAEMNFKGVVDLITMKACIYEGDTGKFVEAEIPSELRSAADEWRQKMVEDVCETDDQLLEKFLDGQDLSTE